MIEHPSTPSTVHIENFVGFWFGEKKIQQESKEDMSRIKVEPRLD